jgi:1,2-diacylglycerol 3-alpha-glucosyltransferase
VELDGRARIAVLWSRFGPYHLARLKGAAETGRSIAEIVGIEVAEADADYAWELANDDGRFERRTLFPQQNYHAVSRRSIRKAVCDTLESLNPNVVAVNGWSVAEARAALFWARRNDCRLILMSETTQDDIKRVWWKELSKRHLVRKFDAALVGGAKQKDYLVSLGMPSERVFLGYDVIDNAHFGLGAEKAHAEATELRRELRLPDRYFLCCTRLLARKNVDGLLKAYAAYRERCTGPWDLVIAGSGPELPKLRSIEASLRIEGVHWPGFVQYDWLPLYYGLASAFIHPAKSEAWGLVVNEAAASGLPLLVSERVGARYELVEHGSNGFLFPPEDLSAICDVLLRASAANASALAEMGRRSLDMAAKWTPDRFGTGLLAAAELSRQPSEMNGLQIIDAG